MMTQRIFIFLCWPLLTWAHSQSFFTTALSQNQAVLERIYAHPFNKALNQGTLAPQRFQAFLEQDQYYLKVYERLAQQLYRTLSPQEKTKFTLLASLSAETKMPVSSKTALNAANQAYTAFLKNIASTQPKEVLLAAMLPCQWVYQAVYARPSIQLRKKKNPYQWWLKVYQSSHYHATTQQLIQLGNQMYANSSMQTQQLMLATFRQSLQYEYEFWNDRSLR
jgi:thiaminase (transcriptional activator TenA)